MFLLSSTVSKQLEIVNWINSDDTFIYFLQLTPIFRTLHTCAGFFELKLLFYLQNLQVLNISLYFRNYERNINFHQFQLLFSEGIIEMN